MAAIGGIELKTDRTMSGRSTTELRPVPRLYREATLVHTSINVDDRQGKEGRTFLFNDALSTFIYGYMASDIWLRSTQIDTEETRCCHYMDYSFRLAARFFYIHHPTYDSTYHGLCYTSRVALASSRNKSMSPSSMHLTTHCTMT